jgi:hypothetical protein
MQAQDRGSASRPSTTPRTPLIQPGAEMARALVGEDARQPLLG